jgi:twitching motility protein PilT
MDPLTLIFNIDRSWAREFSSAQLLGIAIGLQFHYTLLLLGINDSIISPLFLNTMADSITSSSSDCPYDMNDLLDLMVDQGASDLHLQVNQPPTLRLGGGMTPVDGPPLRPEDTESLMLSITSDACQERLKIKGGADFGFAFMDKARFRVSVLKSKGHIGMVLRTIPKDMFGLKQIGLPDKVRELLCRPRGLILVTGPTGSGKSTTLASMINWINENREGHIITIEDPIEYYHDHKRSIVTQREVGNDVPSFSEAIRGALRQDPDVILVGEMRDLETIEAAVSAAETGHLVFATLHTTGAARTVDRIVDAFPASTKDQIRTQLASSIVAVISQVLCKRIGGGRIAGFEIMVSTTSVSALIRDNKTYRIASEIQTGSQHGMIALDTHLMSLVNRGLVDPAEAFEKSQLPDEFRSKLDSMGIQIKI